MKKIIKLSTKIVSILAISSALNTNSQAMQVGVSLGHTNVNIDTDSKSGVNLGYGIYFGETYKQSIDISFDILKQESNTYIDKGNILNVDYSLGYEVYSRATVYGSIGYSLQTLNRVQGISDRYNYAKGFSRGLGIRYNFNKNYTIDLNYKNYNMNYKFIDYDSKLTNISLIYKFETK